MPFTIVHASRVAPKGAAPVNIIPRPGLVVVQADGDILRQYGPCYEKHNKTGDVEGLVWREATLDVRGQEVSSGWRAMKEGCTVPVLCIENTRRAAAARLA